MLFTSPFPDIDVPDISLPDLVLGRAAANRSCPAMVCAHTGRTLTYGELVDHVRSVAAGLAARGIGKGDVVGIWAPNMPEYPIVFHAVARLGAVLTTANPVYTPEELAFQLRDANARLLITIAALGEKARAA